MARDVSGLAEAVERRAAKVGLKGISLHRFRHSFAHQWLTSGGNKGDLMVLLGWRSRTTVSRYAASTAVDLAEGKATKGSVRGTGCYERKRGPEAPRVN